MAKANILRGIARIRSKLVSNARTHEMRGSIMTFGMILLCHRDSSKVIGPKKHTVSHKDVEALNA